MLRVGDVYAVPLKFNNAYTPWRERVQLWFVPMRWMIEQDPTRGTAVIGFKVLRDRIHILEVRRC